MATPSRSRSIERVRDALAQHAVHTRFAELAQSTRTAREAALALGCDQAQIVKSLIFRSGEQQRPLLVLASGSRRVDEHRLAHLLGVSIARADAAFVRTHSGFAIGGVAPVGHASEMLTVMDRHLLAYEEVWAAAGTPHAVFGIAPNDLLRITGAQVADVAE